MWLKYAVSVFRRFSTRYFGICHFFSRYCGIGYPPMSPSVPECRRPRLCDWSAMNTSSLNLVPKENPGDEAVPYRLSYRLQNNTTDFHNPPQFLCHDFLLFCGFLASIIMLSLFVSPMQSFIYLSTRNPNLQYFRRVSMGCVALTL